MACLDTPEGEFNPATSMQAQDGSMVFCIMIHLIETHCDICFILESSMKGYGKYVHF